MFCVNKDGIHTKFVGCRQTQTSTKGVNSIIYLCRFHNKVGRRNMKYPFQQHNCIFAQ
ncbi:hypothetical protein MtrunA17_Chr1g0206801 [Medicago truncatula]|uniref:Uncharacterized protein n=1 Tax=Medicago truncatula TaxID=3880 RepID=A0A396JV02_MEDTR|nr:hypothetical protein MtrunA17_Chr1g0206801 [Medicago truncatula]